MGEERGQERSGQVKVKDALFKNSNKNKPDRSKDPVSVTTKFIIEFLAATAAQEVS